MTKTTRTTKRKPAAKPQSKRQLAGAEAERHWLIVFAVLIMTVVLSACLVAVTKYQWY